MANFDLNNVDGMQFDVLRELGNIGAGNATTALSSMLNTKVDMNVPKVDLLGFDELHEIMGGAETIVVGILVTLDADDVYDENQVSFWLGRYPLWKTCGYYAGGCGT